MLISMIEVSRRGTATIRLRNVPTGSDNRANSGCDASPSWSNTRWATLRLLMISICVLWYFSSANQP